MKHVSRLLKALLCVGVVLPLLGSLLGFAAAQTCVQPPSGLVSWWPGDGNANDIMDSNHGTLQNGATFAAGMVGEAFSFDGSGDFVQVPHNTNLNMTDEITIEAWVKPSRGGVTVVDKTETDDAAHYRFIVGLADQPEDSRVGYFGLGPESNQVFMTDNAIPFEQFSHIAMTLTGNVLTFYINGAIAPYSLVIGSGPPVLGFTNNGPLTIGRDIIGRQFAGLIDELAIYNRALTAEEIAALFNAGSAGKCKGPTGAVFLVTTTQDSGPGSLR